jgi:Secretion system C-terminal sorting domain
MKKILTTLIIAAFALNASAQYYPDGSTVSGTFSLKDINGNTEDAFTILSESKHLVIDLSATWCGPCWGLHTSKVLDNYYDQYGPTGSIANDAQVYLVEVDLTTTAADLNGSPTTSSQGDWVTGTTHPIMDCQTAAEKSSIVGKFVQPGQSYGIPALFVICNDKKLFKLSASTSSAAALRALVITKCGLAPLSTDEIHATNFSFDISPNPASNATNLRLNMQKANDVSYALYNQVGQMVSNYEVKDLGTGLQNLEISTENLPSGLYIVKLQVGGEALTLKVQVAH